MSKIQISTSAVLGTAAAKRKSYAAGEREINEKYKTKIRDASALVKSLTKAAALSTKVLKKQLADAQAAVQAVENQIAAAEKKSGLTKATLTLKKLEDAQRSETVRLRNKFGMR